MMTNEMRDQFADLTRNTITPMLMLQNQILQSWQGMMNLNLAAFSDCCNTATKCCKSLQNASNVGGNQNDAMFKLPAEMMTEASTKVANYCQNLLDLTIDTINRCNKLMEDGINSATNCSKDAAQKANRAAQTATKEASSR